MSADAVLTLVVVARGARRAGHRARVARRSPSSAASSRCSSPGSSTPTQAFAGFSNSAPLTVAALYVRRGRGRRARGCSRRSSPGSRARPRPPRRARRARARWPGCVVPTATRLGVPQQHARSSRWRSPASCRGRRRTGPLAVALPHAGQLRGDRRRHRHADRHLDQPRRSRACSRTPATRADRACSRSARSACPSRSLGVVVMVVAHARCCCPSAARRARPPTPTPASSRSR